MADTRPGAQPTMPPLPQRLGISNTYPPAYVLWRLEDACPDMGLGRLPGVAVFRVTLGYIWEVLKDFLPKMR